METIVIPVLTRQRLLDLVRQRDEISRLIDTVVVTVRDVSNVPSEYILRDVNIGFEPPLEHVDVKVD